MNKRHVVPLATIASTREMMSRFVDDGTLRGKDWWHKAWVPLLHNAAGS